MLTKILRVLAVRPSSSRRRPPLAATAADAARDRGDWLTAAAAYAKVLETLPDHAGYWGQYGNMLKECRRFAEAEAAYKRCLELAPGTPDPWLQLGHLFKIQERRQDASYAYLQALRFDPKLLPALHELQGLGWSVRDVVSTLPDLAALGVPGEVVAAPAPAGGPDVVVDVSELLNFLQHFRRPTGIQRVSLSVLEAWLGTPPGGIRLRYAVLDCTSGDWHPVKPEQLKAVCEEAVGLGSRGGADDRHSLLHLLVTSHCSAPLALSDQTVVLNLGSSVGLPNYHLHVRNAKRRCRIRYVQFTHDCIPLIMPEHFVPEHIPEFLDAMFQVLYLADGFLVNSESTGRDLESVARRTGLELPRPHVIRLDGALKLGAAASQETNSDVIEHPQEPFVLFVSTIEPRKNHLLVFEEWARLVRERGPNAVPRLVCVGSWGWKYQAVREFLERDSQLARRVQVLSAISDSQLSALYRECLFAVYPSLYEGWGLPIAEALQHGKLSLVSRSSSMPEVGGRFAQYFDPTDAQDFASQLRRLLDDPALVRRHEEEIRRNYSPRKWSDIGEQILSAVVHVEPRTGGWLPDVQAGRMYSLAREWRNVLARGHLSGTPFKIGCWMEMTDSGSQVSRTGRSELVLPQHAGGRELLVKVKSPFTATDRPPWLEIEVDGTAAWFHPLKPGDERWIQLPLPGKAGDIRIRFRVTSERGEASAGADVPPIEICGFACMPTGSEAGGANLATALRSLLGIADTRD